MTQAATRVLDSKPFLYVKSKEDKRFMPVHWKTGVTVGRRIFASMFTTEEKVKVEEDLARPENAGLEWEWRK